MMGVQNACDGSIWTAPVSLTVTERSIDTTLSSDCMRTRGEELCNTGSVESGLCETKGSSQTRSTGSDYDGIVFVVDDGVTLGCVEGSGGLLGTERLRCDDPGHRRGGVEGGRGGARGGGQTRWSGDGPRETAEEHRGG